MKNDLGRFYDVILLIHNGPKSVGFFYLNTLNKSNRMYNIPFIPGGIDNLSRDKRLLYYFSLLVILVAKRHLYSSLLVILEL